MPVPVLRKYGVLSLIIVGQTRDAHHGTVSDGGKVSWTTTGHYWFNFNKVKWKTLCRLLTLMNYFNPP